MFRALNTMHRVSLIAPVLIFVLALQGGAEAQNGVGQSTYRVGSGDTLQIAVYGEERLTGRYRVGPDGAIGFPLVGSISVGGLSVQEIQQKLTDELAERIAMNGAPVVDVAEFAQIYITGDVMRPGPHPFQPGMVTLELIALGGGLTRKTESENRVLQLATLEQDLWDVRLQRFALLVQKTRLVAEIQDVGKPETLASGSPTRPNLASAAEPGDYPTTEMRSRIIANERAIYQTRVSIRVNQEKSLNDQRAGYDQEIASLRESIALHDEEIKLLTQDLATQENLLSRGMTLQQKVSDLRRTLSGTRRVALDFRLALARAHQRQLEIDQKLVELRDTRSNEIGRDLRELDLNLERATQRINSLLTTLSEMRSALRDPRRAPQQAPILTVVRVESGRRTETAITDFTELKPRDIVRVVREQPTFISRPELAER